MSNRAARRFEQTNPSTLAPARWRLALAAALALVGLSWTLPMTATPAAATAGKITICHRTHSTTNPYRRITVSQNAVQNARHGGHDLPNGSSNPAVYDPAFSYAPNNKYWGDIIPGGDAAGLVYNGTTAIALNWTAAGQADFATYCAPLTPTQFYNAEIVAGETQTSVLADLNDQAANEDVALLAALGGSFTAANLATWTTAVTVTTTAATQVTTSTATLTGSLTVGSTTTIAQFQYGTSPTLAGSTTVAATPTPVTNTTAVTAAVSGLSPGTTYYFMVTGTTNAGTDTEGVLNGAIMSFDTSPAAPTAQTITFVQPSAMVTGDPAQALTVSASSGLIASVISNDTSVCTVSAATVSTVAAGTCSLTASQPGDSTYSAALPVTRTFAVTAPVSTSTTVAVTTTTVPQTTTTTTATTVPTTTTTTTTVPTTTTATTSPATSTTATTSPATTTTRPPSTTTPEPGIAPGADGIVRGVVWFDRNRNGLLDASEWMLPGVTVTLEDSSTGLRLQTVRAQGGSDRRTAVTAADGSYAFGGLPVGPYRITANVTIQGFDYTSDTDGAADWRVDVSVRALTVSTADFAGLGRGEVTGQVFDSTSLQGVPEARISCRWSGYDDLLGNDDDVMFTLTADASGSFDLAGVPYGYFTCDGRDPSTARQSSPVRAAVFAPEAVNTPLPVGGLDAPLAVPIADVLPSTGDDRSHWLLLAALLLGGGVFAIAIARRPSVR